MRIFSVFHIFLIKFANLDTLIQIEISEINSENQNVKYKIENILNQQDIKD